MTSYYLKECVCKLSRFSHVWRFSTPWTASHLSMGFSRQEYCNGLPSPAPGDLPDPRVKPASPVSLALPVDSLSLSHQWKALGIWVRSWVFALVATFYTFFSFECHNDLPSFILHSGLFWFCIMIFQFGCCGKGGACKLGRSAWSHALMISDAGRRHARLRLWGRRIPEAALSW